MATDRESAIAPRTAGAGERFLICCLHRGEYAFRIVPAYSLTKALNPGTLVFTAGYIPAANSELTVTNAELMAPANVCMAATQPRAIKATTRAYSTRSWPSSRFNRLQSSKYDLRNMMFTALLPIMQSHSMAHADYNP